jgi:hypothetical protein
VSHGDRTLQWRSRCAKTSWPAKLAGVSRCRPGSFPGPAGAEKEAHNPDRAAASITAHPSPYPEVQPGCTGCRVHPGCTKVIATRIKQDVECSRGAGPTAIRSVKFGQAGSLSSHAGRRAAQPDARPRRAHRHISQEPGTSSQQAPSHALQRMIGDKKVLASSRGEFGFLLN